MRIYLCICKYQNDLTMKITITGSIGNIGQHLAKKLVAKGIELTVVTSSSERKTAIETLGAKAAVGSITDTDFLTGVFDGADAVFVMTPPNMGGSNVVANTIKAGKSYLQAIKNAGVKRVVMLSSVGAEFEAETGPIVGLHHIEKLYGNLSDANVTYLRAGYFYTNFYNDIPLIKNAGIEGSNFPADLDFPVVHPSDIATAVTEELTKNAVGHNVRYIVSDVVKGAEIAHALGTAIGKPELPWVEFTDEQSFGGMTGAGLPEELANLYTELGAAVRKGLLQKDFNAQGAPIYGKVKLADFAQEFASKF